MTYENRNQVDPRQLSVRQLNGRVLVEVGEPAQEIGPASGACLGLFSYTGEHLVATTTADEDGHFKFGPVASGKYRLVVQVKGLCTANVPLQIGKSRSRKQKRQLIVHMRAAGIDTCSYADYK